MDKIISRYTDTSNGYIKLYLSGGRIIEEHRLLMEQHLGRKLDTNEVVHHKDGDKQNNSLENLELITRSNHASVHHKDTTWIKLVCTNCEKVFERDVRNVRTKMKNGQTDFYCCRSCAAQSFGRGRLKGG